MFGHHVGGLKEKATCFLHQLLMVVARLSPHSRILISVTDQQLSFERSDLGLVLIFVVIVLFCLFVFAFKKRKKKVHQDDCKLQRSKGKDTS